MAEERMDPFEVRLAARLEAFAAIPIRPVDADAVASAVVSRRRWPWPAHRTNVVPLPGAMWVFLALAAAIVAGLLVGSLLQQLHPQSRRPLVLATEIGLYVGEVGQQPSTGLTLVRDDGSFINPRWSPTGDRIAVLHGPAIAPQVRTEGALPLTPVPFTLEATSLLVLDDQGATLSTWPGPIVDFAWAPPDADGASLLALKGADGAITVVDADGRIVGSVSAAPLLAAAIGGPDEPALLPSRIAWASPTVVVYADGARVDALDVKASGRIVTVASVGPAPSAASRMTAIATSSDGMHLAFLVAPCDAGCTGQVRTAMLPRSYSSSAGGAPSGRGILQSVPATTGLTWTEDASAVLAWPLLASSAQHGAARTAPTDAVLAGRDTVAAWTRLAADGSGRVIVMNSFPAFNDQHFDAWLVDPAGGATRLAARSLGVDLRAATNPADEVASR